MLFILIGFIFMLIAIFSLDDYYKRDLDKDKKDYKRIMGYDYK